VATLIGAAQGFVATVLRISGGQSAHEAEDLVVSGIMREEAAGLATSPPTWTIRLLAILLLTLLVLPTVVILGIGAVGLKGGHQLHKGLHLIVDSQTGEASLELVLPLGAHRQHRGVPGQQPEVQLRVVRLQIHHVPEGILITMLHCVFGVAENIKFFIRFIFY